MNSNNLVIILCFAGLFVLFILWHGYENAALGRQLARKTDAPTGRWLQRFAWIRTSQLLAALAGCMILTAAYDRQISSLETDRRALAGVIRQKDEALKEARLAAARPTPQPSPDPSVDAAVVRAPAQEPPAAPPPREEGGNSGKTEIDESAAAMPAGDTAMDALYNPERSRGDQQSAMDDMKKRYEDILVIYMYLKKCSTVQVTDYNVIAAAMAQEIASINAPGRLQHDILTSAQGAYQEIYAKSACDSKATAGLNRQYRDYIAVLTATLSPPP